MKLGDYLSRVEAAEYLRMVWGTPVAVYPRTLAKLESTGGGPECLHFGRRVAYTREALDRWAMARRVDPIAHGTPPSVDEVE